MDKKNRRKVLKTLAAAAPAVWVSPVVKGSDLPPPGYLTCPCAPCVAGSGSGFITGSIPVGTLNKWHFLVSYEFPYKLKYLRFFNASATYPRQHVMDSIEDLLP